MRIIFMGTAELACASLKALTDCPGLNVLSVVTQPDRPKGRDLKLQPSAVKVTALEKQIPVLQPQKARDPGFVDQLRQLAPDLIVVAAFGQILPQSILELPKHGCINVHTSLLPRHRGAAPIQWAILEGDSETGVTIMKMDAALDTGDILTQERTPIRADDDAETLHDRLAEMGAELLVKTIPDYVAGKIVPQKQPAEGVTYARKITKEDGFMHWDQPARVLSNRVRGLTPWPGAFTFYECEGKRLLLKIWSAVVERGIAGSPGEIVEAGKNGIVVACGQDALRLLEVQRESRPRMKAAEFLVGHPFKPGTKLNLR